MLFHRSRAFLPVPRCGYFNDTRFADTFKRRRPYAQSCFARTLVFVFYFSNILLHSALIAELLITGNKIILSKRGAHLRRLILCPLVKLYIMTTILILPE